MGTYTTQYDTLFQRYHVKYLDHTPYPWQILKAQAIAESGLNTCAISPVGAKGLMQLMPATDFEIDADMDAFDPAGNVDNGARYMARQYEKFGEIPDELERYKFALAAYNAGRGHINNMLMLARDDEGLPADYKAWTRAGCPSGEWQRWSQASLYLSQVTGHHSVETVNYVNRILRIFAELIREGGQA